MAYVTKHLDWLSCNVSQSDDPRMVFPLLDWHFMGAGHHGYRARYECGKTGAVLEMDSADTSMGNHFTFSGEALNSLRRDYGGTDTGLVNHLVRRGAKASRIDLTINIHEGNITPASMRDALRKGTCQAKSKVSRFIEGKNGDIEGDTLYIGSPTSDRQFRCYNKAAETGIMDRGAWVRLELELRRLRANGALQACGVNGVGPTISGHMEDFLDWRDIEFQRALGSEGVEPLELPRKATNRQRWLLGQVAQALAKEICVDEDFALKFWSSVGAEVARIKTSE